MATEPQIAAAATPKRKQNHMGGLTMLYPVRPPAPPEEVPAPSMPLWNTRAPNEHERSVIEEALAAQRESEWGGLLGGLVR